MKHTLCFRDLCALYRALGNLDGFQKTVGERAVFTPFRFSDATRRLIVKNRRALKPHTEEYEEQEQTLVRTVAAEFSAKDGDAEPRQFIDELNPAEVAAFTARQRKLQREEKREVELFPIAESELLAENKNPIPATVLEDLAVLTEDGGQKTED